MPCDISEDIPIANYGSSGAGQFRKVYRRGLAFRYGKKMQAIAGLHYNFSPSESFWHELSKVTNEIDSKDFRSRNYFNLLRNFRSLNWFLNYLFGASPAFHSSFSELVESDLKENLNQDTDCLPNAVSVRMSDAGYTTSRQGNLNISVNNVEEYTEGLRKAVTKSDKQWNKLPAEDEHGPTQLTPNFLQAEFEYYSTIRPKPDPKINKRPIDALKQGGVNYIEVRTIDINPFEPLGICKHQIDFMEVFIYYLLLKDSRQENDHTRECARDNLMRVTIEGRKENLNLRCPQKDVYRLDKACRFIIKDLSEVAKILDQSRNCQDFTIAVNEIQKRLDNPSLLPSARVMKALKQSTYIDYFKGLSEHHKTKILAISPDQKLQQSFEKEAIESLQAQTEIEQNGPNYHEYLSNFLGE